jgi:LuxR family maltose regulon positive regulatory protein
MALVEGDMAAAPPLDAAARAPGAADEPFGPSVERAPACWRTSPRRSRSISSLTCAATPGTAGFASQALASGGGVDAGLVDSVDGPWRGGCTVARRPERGFAAIVAGSGGRWRPWPRRPAIFLATSSAGPPGRGARHYQRALEITALPGQAAMPAAGIGYVGMAEVAYQRGELDAALRHVTEGIARCRQLNWTQPLATGLVTLAWIRQAKGDPAGALEAIGEAERAAPGPAVADLFNPVPAQRARLLLAQGQVAAAARWTQQRGLADDDEPAYLREREHLVLARVLLAQDRPRPALALLDRLHAPAAAQGRAGSVIEIQALQALALAADGDQAAAVDRLAAALTLACPQGYVRVFADEGAPMGVLLGRLVAARRAELAAACGVPLGCLARVLQAFGQKDAEPGSRPRTAPAVPGLVDQLTVRELEILRLLAAGAPNQAIAEQLVVTLDTVKKHITHLLGKLGAANRTEAAAIARQLGLIP